jgi:hypothetical protein
MVFLSAALLHFLNVSSECCGNIMYNRSNQVQITLWPTVSRSVCLGVGSITTIFITVGHLLSLCFRAPSLTKGLVCNLLIQFAATLRPSLSELMITSYCLIWDHILLSHTRLPQPGGPGPCIYIPQEQSVSDIPPGTEFPFLWLLRLVRLQWKYSIPPPHRFRSHRFLSNIYIYIYSEFAVTS